MKTNFAVLGTFLLVGLVFLTTILFLIGNRNQAFSKHEDLYVEMATVTGIAPGSKIRVSGIDAGEVKVIELPPHPSGNFRVKLEVDKKLHAMIRKDSLVTVESDGLVGDRFLMIHAGTDSSPEAASGSTLPGKEPVELSAIITKVSGTVDELNATIGDVRGRLDGTLDVVTKTVNNTDGLVSDARNGKGTVGMLLNDRQTAEQVKRAVSNVQKASANLNDVSVQAQQLMSDIQSRNLPAKLDDTMVNARDASQQINQVSHTVNATITDALAPDQSGVSAAENLRDTLSNVNRTTGNLADDTEALKHEFFFRGFFKKRGFYSLDDLTPESYRNNTYFQNPLNRRFWIEGAEAFASTGPIGLFVGKTSVSYHVELTAADGHSVLAKDMTNSKRMDTESLDVAKSVAKAVAKRLHRLPTQQSAS